MNRLAIVLMAFLLAGCASQGRTIISNLSGSVSEFAQPVCVQVDAVSGNLAGQARSLLLGVLRAEGTPIEQPCPGTTPFVRVEVTASDTVLSTGGRMPGQLRLEATLQLTALGSRGPGARLWLLRPDVYYLEPDVSVLADAILHVFRDGTIPPRAHFNRQ